MHYFLKALVEGTADLSEEKKQFSLMGTRAPENQLTEEGKDIDGYTISAFRLSYCDVPGSPCLSKMWIKCTVRFFLNFFIGSYG